MDEFERRWRARFETFARNHSEEYLVSGWSRQGLLRRVTEVGRLIHDYLGNAPLRVLDLGCGSGTYVRLLTGLGYRVIGLDYSMPTLRRARNGDLLDPGTYVEGEAYRLPFRDGTFDLVLGIGILQALADTDRAIDQLLRVLRPGGWVILETLNAAELMSAARRTLAAFRGRRDPVRAYSPFRVREWLSRKGAQPLRQTGIYIPPRCLEWLAPAFEPTRLPAALEAIPGARLISAHAFLTLAQKRT